MCDSKSAGAFDRVDGEPMSDDLTAESPISGSRSGQGQSRQLRAQVALGTEARLPGPKAFAQRGNHFSDFSFPIHAHSQVA